jgi:hypothetical protein
MGLGYTRVSVELDCKLVMDGMKGSPIQRTEFSAILCACKRIMQSLPNFRISFIRRQANNVAHLLAREALSYVYSILYCD